MRRVSRRLPPALLATLALAGCREPTFVGAAVDAPTSEEDCLVRNDNGDASDLSFRSCIPFIRARAVDLLFVIDDSASSGPLQAQLAAAVDNLLSTPDQLLRPDLRIGFVTARGSNPVCDDGPVQLAPISSCHERRSAFVSTEGVDSFDASCAAVCPLEQLAVTDAQPWISFGPDGTNLPEGVAPSDALRCAMPMGVSGCGYPAVLDTLTEATANSLDTAHRDYGFFRPSASPVIVIVTNGIDCSIAPDHLDVFAADGPRGLWSDPKAEAATPAVCWNAGVQCSPQDGPEYDTCDPASLDAAGIETSPRDSVMLPVSHYEELFDDFVSELQRVAPWITPAVFTLAGVPVDGGPAAYAQAQDPAFDLEFGIGPGCDGPAGPALPPVRLRAFTESQRGDRLRSACAPDLTAFMVEVREAIASAVRPSCAPACVADVDAELPGLQVDCRMVATDRVIPECEGELIDRELPADEELCWFKKTDENLHPQCRDQGSNLEVELYWEGPKPEFAGTALVCTLSDDRARDCPDL